jgi:23S rRNA pseudouridine1911/1915/1917 synthase
MTDPPAVVLFEDAHVVAVFKPAGLPTQAPPGRGPTLEEAVRRHLAPDDPGSVYLGTVHRLDRPVSGVVVWAKTQRAARRLSKAFEARRAVKEYWAVVETDGIPPMSNEGVWDDWLTRHSDATGVVRVVAPGAGAARRAVTRYRVEPGARVPEGSAWLRLWPETGRTHQLRAQAAARGRPVWGDAAYGAKQTFPTGIALHAYELTFPHPALGRAVVLTAPPPDAWADSGFVPPDGGR